MNESVEIILIFCVTVIAIVGMVALVVYNRDNLTMKVKAEMNIKDKIKNSFEIRVEEDNVNKEK